MAVGSSLSGISFSGIGSGIDTGSIVERLIAVESLPLQRMQARQKQINQTQSVFSAFRTRLQALSTAASALNTPTAFSPIGANSTNTATATITAESSASSGTYNLSVTRLAQAQKVASAARPDTTSTLGLTPGSFVINGKEVTVDGSDSLRSLAQKINSANAGVTASLIDGGSGNAFMTLTANATGAVNRIQMADLSGSTLSSLGLVGGTAAIRESITNGAASVGFSSPSSTFRTLLPGMTGSPTFEVNGTTITVDPETDTLQSLANKITSTVAGVTATVRAVTVNGQTSHKLDIVGNAGTPTFTDGASGFLQAIGVLQRPAANELLAGQDAQFSIDNLPLTSASNTVTNVIPGATITLLKGNATTPETTTLSLTRDTNTITNRVKDFMNAYNGAIDFIRSQSQFNKETFASGPLFGNATAQQVEASLGNMILNSIPGLTGDYRNLAAVGFNIDQDGKLSLDENALKEALNRDPDGVTRLFRATGSGSTPELSFISSTSRSVSSGTGNYAVNITQVATKGDYTGEIAPTTTSGSETLTFNGALLGNSSYQIQLGPGMTGADIVQRINTDSRLKDLVSASLDAGGRLKIESKRFGTNGNFTVFSNLEAASTNSGLGVGMLGTKTTGVDVAGTIHGEPAVGSGQFLTGSSGNARTDGLQIQYTGNALGAVGNVQFTKGMGAMISDLMQQFTDGVNGLLTGTDQALTSELDTLTADIESLSARLQQKRIDLLDKFTKMDSTVASLQAQAQRLSALRTSSAS